MKRKVIKNIFTIFVVDGILFEIIRSSIDSPVESLTTLTTLMIMYLIIVLQHSIKMIEF